MKSKKSAGYSPNYGSGFPSLSVPLIKVWKIVKKILPLIGTLPFLLISFGLIRIRASSGKAENALKAWFAKMFLSARNNILGLLKPSRFKFQRVWNNFHAI